MRTDQVGSVPVGAFAGSYTLPLISGGKASGQQIAFSGPPNVVQNDGEEAYIEGFTASADVLNAEWNGVGTVTIDIGPLGSNFLGTGDDVIILGYDPAKSRYASENYIESWYLGDTFTVSGANTPANNLAYTVANPIKDLMDFSGFGGPIGLVVMPFPAGTTDNVQGGVATVAANKEMINRSYVGGSRLGFSANNVAVVALLDDLKIEHI
jgi:hypothetical protein